MSGSRHSLRHDSQFANRTGKLWRMNPPDSPHIVRPLVACPKCNLEMRLFGIEAESDMRDLYTFECGNCRALEVRGVLVGTYKGAPQS